MDNVSCFKVIDWFSKNFPTYVEEMNLANHTIKLDKINPYHGEGSIWTHTMMVMNSAFLLGCKKETFWASLLHDVGKYDALKEEDDKTFFKDHEYYSFWKSIEILNNAPNLNTEEKIKILTAVLNHTKSYKMFDLNTKTHFKRFLNYYTNNQESLDITMELFKCDFLGRWYKDKYKIDFLNGEDFPKPVAPTRDIKSYKNELHVMVGLPGSGKSTFIKNNFDKDIPIFSNDELMLEYMKLKGVSKKDCFRDDGYKLFYKEKFIEFYMGNHSKCLIDQTNLRENARHKRMVTFTHYKKIAHVLLKPLHLCYSRRCVRGAVPDQDFIPDSVFYDMALNFEMPSYSSFDEINYYF